MATAAELAIVLKAKDEASAVLKKVSAETAALGKSGDTANKGLSSLASGFKGAVAAAAGIAVAVGGVTALTSAVGNAVGSAIDFEKSMSGIKAVSGATGQQMQQLSALALELGKSTSFSAGEAADGISELVKGGVSIGDVFGGAASAALDLAAAGGVSVGEAATIAANAMNQFSLKGSDMAHVSDLVAGAANASSISVSDFNQSLAAGGATAALAGQSIDSFSTAVALMGAVGIKGSDAGTSLKAALNTLIPTTTAAKDAMRELGIITADGSNQFINAQGQMKSFREIGEILQTSLSGLTDSQRLYNLELIFGQDGQRAAGVLAKAGAEGFDAMATSMTAAGGAAAIARERLNNAAGDIEQLKGSLETAAITVGSLFLPAVRSIAQTATSAVNTAVDEFNTLRASAENIAGAHGIGLIPAALTAVELRIGEVLGSTAQRVFHDARSAVEDLAAAFATTQQSAAVFADIMAARLAPAIEGVRDAAQGAAPVVGALGDAFGAVGETVEPLTRQFADFLIQQNLVSGKTRELTGQQQQAAAITDALWAIYENSPIGRVVTAFGELSAAVKQAQGATEEAATGADRAWQAFLAGAGAVRDAVVARLGEMAAFVSTLPGRFAEDGAATGVALVQGIVNALNPASLVAACVNMVTQAVAAAQGTASAQAPAIGSNIAQGMAAGIAGGIGAVTAAARNLAASALASARAALGVSSPSKEFEAIGEDVDQGFIDGVEGMTAEVEQSVADLMTGAGEVAVQTAEEAFAELSDVLGAQYEKQYTIVEEAENKLAGLRIEAQKKGQRDAELEEIKFQRRLADLQESRAGMTVKQQQSLNEKIQQLQEDHGRKLEDIAQASADRLVELEYDNSDLLAAAMQKQALVRGAALRDLQRGVDDVNRSLNEGLAANARKAGEAVSAAMRDAADAIIEAKDRAAEAIAELEANQTLSRDIRGRRDQFAEGQDEASREFSEKREDADLEYRLTKDLEKAKLKLGKDRAKAETEEERRQADIRYAESVEDLRQGFEDAKADLRRRRQLEEQERAFRKQQQQALQAFNDALEDEALKRQVKRIQDERDSRIKEIGVALDEKIAAVRRNEKEENEELRRSADEKLNDLRTRFYDKVGELNQDSKDKFEALFAAIKKGVSEAADAANDLAEAINRVATTKLPGAAAGGGGGGGATWANQTQAVRDMFTAAHGSNAEAQWNIEHNREEVAAMGGNLPGPIGTDPISGNPIGPGYYQPIPDTDYWRGNWQRFAQLPWGTEYPPQAFGNYGDSNDLLGGNNRSTEDYPDYQYASGGMVPGPTGAARLATVHGGEGVFTPDQLAALARYGGGGGGGGDAGYWAHSHDIVLDGVVVGRAVEPYVSGAQDSAVRLGLG